MSEIAACTLIQEEPDRKTERYMMMFKDYPDVVSVDKMCIRDRCSDKPVKGGVLMCGDYLRIISIVYLTSQL